MEQARRNVRRNRHPGPGGRTKAARADLPRASLAAALDAETELSPTRRQPWFKLLVETSTAHSLVDSLDTQALSVIVDARAEDASRLPPISVKRLAAFVGATLDVSESTDSRYPEGWIERTGPLAWQVVVTKPTYSAYRFSVAHELAHALLYRRRSDFDFHAWYASTSSDLEEAVADYLGRCLLAPEHLVRNRVRSDCNAAEAVCRVLMDEFRLPMRQAALRWLDLFSASGEPSGSLIWDSYHPFARNRVAPALASIPDEVAGPIVAALSVVQGSHAEAGIPRPLAQAIWLDAHAFASNQVGSMLPGVLPPELERLRNALREALRKERTAVTEVLDQICGTAPHLAVRPEWFAWQGMSERPFVPCWRGHARPSSLVSDVVIGSADMYESRPEHVSIGTLSGDFLVEVGGRGDWKAGSRRVIQMLRAPGARGT